MKSIIFAAFALFTTLAQALDLEVGIGQSSYKMPPNSQYYQIHVNDNVPYSFDLKTGAYSLGVSDYMSTPKWMPATRWRVEYLNQGTVRSVAKGTSDVNYDMENLTCVSLPCATGTFATWSVSSRHRGVVTSIAPEWSALGGKVFVEAGIYWGAPKITVTIDRATGETETYRYKGGLNAGSLIGAGYQYGKTSISFRYIHVDAVNRNKGVFEEDLPPNHDQRVLNVMLRHQF